MQRVGIIGAGTMGHGIAQVCAQAGYDVRITDHSPAVLARGLAKVAETLAGGVARGKLSEVEREAALERLHGAPNLDEAVGTADLVIEAVPENLALKQALFASVEASAPDHCLIATNTSSLSVTRLAESLEDSSRFLGMHFFNPVHLMALLELVTHPGTSPACLASARNFGERIGKSCITVNDAPGFASSRLGVALGMEAIRMVEQGVASPADIDLAMTLGYRHPVGPLKLSDMVGLDVRMAIGEYLAKELGNPAFEPPALMREMVAKGHLGKKSGKGFYDWS